jgi:DNA-binding HxlR family transcriptional regulator
MRSYGELCPIAKALDVVGDRWTLLIVRELLIKDAARYTDLRNGLPGIATNLLSDRLRQLEEAGVIVSEKAPPPIATTLFRLTRRGLALKPILHELGTWGVPELAGGAETDAFQTHWLAFSMGNGFVDAHPDRPPTTIAIRTGDAPLTLEVADGRVQATQGGVDDADLVVTGDHRIVVDLLLGGIDLDEAVARGLQLEGNVDALERLQPRPRG